MRRLIALLLITVTGGFIVGTTVDARAADPAAESTFLTLTNQVRASRGLPGLGVHPVLVAKAQAWAEHMAATGCLCHSNLTDGITVGWRKIGENVGVGPSIGTIHNALVASPPHLENMVGPQFHWVGIGVAYGGGRMWVSEVFMDGDAPPIDPALLLKLDSRGRGIAARPQGGFWILSGNGNVSAFEGAPDYGHPLFGGDIARDIVAMPDGNGYAILDGFGGVHKYGSAVAQLSRLRGSPYWRGWDIARSIALAPGGGGYAVLDGWGGVHPVGNIPAVSGMPTWVGWDIARSIAFTPQGGLYLLDGFGGVWTSGRAARKGMPYFGWDIARDIVVWPGGNGYAVIDGFGGIHRFGSAKTPGATAYAPIDRFRGITVQLGTYLVIRNDGHPQRV